MRFCLGIFRWVTHPVNRITQAGLMSAIGQKREFTTSKNIDHRECPQVFAPHLPLHLGKIMSLLISASIGKETLSLYDW